MTLAARLLRDRRRSFAWWSLGVVLVIGLTIALWPSIRGDHQFDKMVNDLPAAVKAMMGAGDGVSFTSPAGYLNARQYALMLPVLLVVFGIGLGSRAVGAAEEDGTIEPLLAEPISRRRVALERLVAALAMVTALALVAFVMTAALAPTVGLLDGVGLGHLAGASVAMLWLAWLHTVLAFAVGCSTGRRATAYGVSGGVAVAGYVVYGLVASASAVRPLRLLSPWHWYLQHNLLVQAPGVEALVAPLVVTVVLVALGVARFERRDLRLP